MPSSRAADSHHLPDGLRTEPVAPHHPALFDRAKDPPGGAEPLIDGLLHPGGHGNAAHPLSLPFQIQQHPARLPHLEASEGQSGTLAAAQGAAEQQRQDRVVALAFGVAPVGNGKQLARLLQRQPVPCPDAPALGALGAQH